MKKHMGFYRVVVRVPDRYVEYFRRSHAERTQPQLLADVEGRIQRLASGRVLTTMQDPTGPAGLTQFTIIGEWTAPPTLAMRDDVLQIVRVEEVEAPPTALRREGTRVPWDSGLLPDEVTMVENALLSERNPRHLHGIAATMEPYFPAAASILDAKGDLVEQKVLMDRSAARELEAAVADYALPPDLLAQIGAERDRLAAYVARFGIPEMVAREEVKRTAGALIDPNGKMPRGSLAAGTPLASLLPRTIRFQNRPIKIICPYALRAALPPDPEDGALNETAVQLAIGAQKPKMTMIAVEQQIPGRLRQVSAAPVRMDVGRPLTLMERKYLRASANLERARQAIERRRWVDWYRRRERAQMLGA